MDDVELNQHGRSGRIVDVVDARDRAVDPDDLSGTCRRSLHALRSDIHLGGLLHHDRRTAEEPNRDLAFERATGRDGGQADGRERGQDQSGSAQGHGAPEYRRLKMIRE